VGEKKKELYERIWGFFASVKLAIMIFAVVSLTSIVGTVLQQNADAAKNIEILSKFVGASAAPGAYKFMDMLGFLDMYRSWWFISLLGLFAANLIICSIDRFPHVWKAAREKQKPLNDEQFKVFPIKREFIAKGKVDEIKDKVLKVLASAGFKNAEVAIDGDEIQVFSKKQAYSRLGVYITHLSLLVIMLGSVIGSLWGFNGYINIPEGTSYPVAFASKPMSEAMWQERNMVLDTLLNNESNLALTASALSVSEERLVKRMKTLGLEYLGFEVGLMDFDVTFYGNSDMAKEYTSHLSVKEGGQELFRLWIEVNQPLKHKGFTFYQSSYGMMEQKETFVYNLRARGTNNKMENYKVKIGDSLTIPGTEMEMTVVDFSPSLRFDQSGRAFTYADMLNNPAIRVEIKDGDAEYAKWIMKRYPQTWNLGDGNALQFVDVWGAQYTGLQVRRDPGVWLVYLGCLIMGIGLYFAFFMSHRRIWIRIIGGKGNAKLTVAASAYKGREGFERKVDQLITLLTEGGK
jgi:cytochrome c biogenesis protein